MTTRSTDGTTDSGTGDTAGRILDIAERLIQTRGFNDFSYADVAAELGVAKPSLHYHFRTKALLGEALVRRYSATFYQELDHIDRTETSRETKLARYVALYRVVLASRRMCLCGMLAAEYHSLPMAMRAAVDAFFERNEAWLEQTLAHDDGGESITPGEARTIARAIIDTLEGSVMIARTHDDLDRFDRSAQRLLASVVGRA